MKINIFNETAIRFKRKFINTIKMLVKNTLKKNFNEVNLIFVGDNEIKKLNKKFLNKDKTTDVIAFNYNNEIMQQKLADIYISLDTAKKNAKEYGLEFETEILILVVHGTLHIAGYNDKTKKERKKMNELSLKILKTLF